MCFPERIQAILQKDCCTIPLKAVDLQNYKVFQFPSLGVHTKNGKHATTHLLNIPDLYRVVKAWDAKVRAIVPADGYWFAHLSPKTGEIDRDNRSVGVYRGNLARRNLEDWMERVGLPYHSPHKFRHGHIQYLVMNAEDRGDLKAISENVMHESVEFTDRVYSRINDETVQSRLNRMVSNDSPGGNEIDELKNILARIEQRIDKIQA